MGDKKLLFTEIDEDADPIRKVNIHHSAIIDTSDDGRVSRFDIMFVDPASNKKMRMTYDEFKKYPHDDPLFLNYDWELMEAEFDRAYKSALKDAQRKKEMKGKEPTTYQDVIYRKLHYYKENSEERGIILEKYVIDRRIKNNQPVKSSEKTVETFYEFRMCPEKEGEFWIYDDILDDILERGIKEIRILVNDELFYLAPKTFLNHGRIADKKVYIDTCASTFKANRLGEHSTEIWAEGD